MAFPPPNVTIQSLQQLEAYSSNLRRMVRPGAGYAVAIGDSITAWNGDGSPLRQRHTWFQQLCARSKQQIRYGGVYATSGYTLSQIRDTHLPSVLALEPQPSACFVFGGTNTEVSGLLRDGMIVLDQICTALMKNGIAPVLVTLLPRNDSSDSNQHKWNVALRRYADKQGFLLLDANLAMITSAGQRDSSLYEDNVHADWPGHTAIAERGIADGLHDEWPQARVTSKTNGLSPNIGDAFNLIGGAYGLFNVDTDANGLADGLSAAGTNVTYSLVNPGGGDDLVGKWQRVTRTTGGATSTVFQRQLSTGFAVGDKVAYCGRFRATVEGTGSTYTFQATFNGASAHNLEPIYNWDIDISDGAFYGEAVVPAGTTSISVQAALSVPSSGTPQLDVGEWTLWNLSSAEALLP